MKRKLFALGFLAFAATTVVAQEQAWVCNDTVITDTIHYYYNKFHFKSGLSIKNFPYYMAAASTGTAVTHIGNRFDNNEPLDVVGLEGFLKRHFKTATESVKPIVVRLYLADLDVNGKPKLPPIDSTEISMMPSTPDTVPVGGPLKGGIRRVTGNYAVLFRNMSNREGDTIHVLRTNGHTPQSVAPYFEKCSDSYGFARYKAAFYSTTNFSVSGFGYGSDFEFLLAPRVQYTLNAGQIVPSFPINDSIICTQQQVTFTSTASARISDRFYNLIEFVSYWNKNPFFNPNTMQQYKFPDEKRGVGWHFYSEDDKNYYLAPGSNTLVFYTDSAWKQRVDPHDDSVTCYVGNWYHAKLYGMNANGGGYQFNGGNKKFFCEQFFNYCTQFCNGDNVGLADRPLDHVTVYPNPATGTVRLKGLHGEVSLTVFDMTGRTLISRRASGVSDEIDISALPPGNYMLRVSNGVDSRTLKIQRIN